MCVSSRTSTSSAKFQGLSKVLKTFSPLSGDNAHLTKSFVESLQADVFHLSTNLDKLDQFSQQNTHCRTVILQNTSLNGAPKNDFVSSFL